MTARFIDLSIAIDNDIVTDPERMRPRITYIDHHASFPQMAQFFPGLERQDLPDGEAWAVEEVTLSTHCGTHMDAPWHYASLQDVGVSSDGRPAMTIDEVPLEWCQRPGVKLDFRHVEDGTVLGAVDLERALHAIGHDLAPLDIVLINSRAGDRYGHPDYLTAGCGIGREGTLFLTERGVRIVGTDAWSWDAPFIHTARKWAKTRDPALIWEGHKAGRERGYFQIEKLHGLERLPATGFIFSCFPIKISRASAGWIRAVAIID